MSKVGNLNNFIINMFNKCPFFPNEVNPCQLHQCLFRCEGGCAISLGAYSKDAFNNTEDLKEELKQIKDKLKYYIEPDIRKIKQQLSK